jgi:hypothetical protein
LRLQYETEAMGCKNVTKTKFVLKMISKAELFKNKVRFQGVVGIAQWFGELTSV